MDMKEEFEKFMKWRREHGELDEDAEPQEVIDMPETKTETFTVPDSGSESEKVVEIPSEEIMPLKKAHELASKARQDLAQLLLGYEQQKKELMEMHDQHAQVVQSKMKDIREKHDIPENATITLPDEDGGSGTAKW